MGSGDLGASKSTYIQFNDDNLPAIRNTDLFKGLPVHLLCPKIRDRHFHLLELVIGTMEKGREDLFNLLFMAVLFSSTNLKLSPETQAMSSRILVALERNMKITSKESDSDEIQTFSEAVLHLKEYTSIGNQLHQLCMSISESQIDAHVEWPADLA